MCEQCESLTPFQVPTITATSLPSCTVAGTEFLRVKDSEIFLVATTTKAKRHVLVAGGVTGGAALDASVVLDRPPSNHLLSTTMMLCVFKKRHYGEILWSVVQRIAVDMVDVLVRVKFAAKLFFEHNSMLIFPDIRVGNFYQHINEVVFAGMQAPRAYGTVARIDSWHGPLVAKEG